jgi:hypothetical protein
VRDDDRGRRHARDEALEPGEAPEVEMVAGLVEDEEVGLERTATPE